MSVNRPTTPAFAEVPSTLCPPVDQEHHGSGDGGLLVAPSVWQGAFAQNVLPFLTSLGVHSTLVILGILTYQAFVVVGGPSMHEQTLTPDMGLTASLPGIEDAYLGPSDQPDRRATQQDDPSVPPDATGFSQQSGLAAELYSSGGEGTEATDDYRIALGPGGFGPANGDRIGPGDGNGPGGRGGRLAPFGSPGGGIPSGSIFTGKDRVRSVAYVCDASGSMIDKFEPLRDQLNRSVTSLKAVQSFNVIFFQEEKAAGLSQAQLLPALSENKRKAQQFLEGVHPTGPTDPIPALELAFRQKPELIWLLTDGDFPDNAAVLAFIRQRNKGGKVRINTIAFVTRDEGYEKVLRAIAEENGGQFRFVAEAELD